MSERKTYKELQQIKERKDGKTRKEVRQTKAKGKEEDSRQILRDRIEREDEIKGIIKCLVYCLYQA